MNFFRTVLNIFVMVGSVLLLALILDTWGIRLDANQRFIFSGAVIFICVISRIAGWRDRL